MCCEHEEFNQTLFHATAIAADNYVQFYVKATVSVHAKQSIVNNQYIINISVGRIHTVTNQLPPVHQSIHASWVNENMLRLPFYNNFGTSRQNFNNSSPLNSGTS